MADLNYSFRKCSRQKGWRVRLGLKERRGKKECQWSDCQLFGRLRRGSCQRSHREPALQFEAPRALLQQIHRHHRGHNNQSQMLRSLIQRGGRKVFGLPGQRGPILLPFDVRPLPEEHSPWPRRNQSRLQVLWSLWRVGFDLLKEEDWRLVKELYLSKCHLGEPRD